MSKSKQIPNVLKPPTSIPKTARVGSSKPQINYQAANNTSLNAYLTAT